MACSHTWHRPKEEDIASHWYGDSNLICCKCAKVTLVPFDYRGYEYLYFFMCDEDHGFGEKPKY